MTHELEILDLGFTPAALCKCGHWGFAMTEKNDDTQAGKKAIIEQAHREHVQEQEQHHQHHEPRSHRTDAP